MHFGGFVAKIKQVSRCKVLGTACQIMIVQNVSSIVSQNSTHPFRPVRSFLIGRASCNPWSCPLFFCFSMLFITCIRAFITQCCSYLLVLALVCALLQHVDICASVLSSVYVAQCQVLSRRSVQFC